MNPKKAIFWDNDGILVDTEKYYFEATRRILQKVGFELTRELYIELFLVQAKGAWHLLDPEKYSAGYILDLRKERDDLYHEYLRTREILIDGIEELVAGLSKKYRMAIVTSSKSKHFYAIHERTGLLKYFEFVVTPDDYTKYKPDPEPYLLAMQKMGVSGSESIAIEDSRRGLMAARAAGMQCIIVKNELTETSDFSEADYVLTHIRELTRIL
ncbi:MAG TPA: HAD family phosphatase [Bacteroidales bacterium]